MRESIGSPVFISNALAHTSVRLGLVVLSALLAGAMNAIAGGGTLVTFPALVALGVPPINANATSTVALWPASISSMWGYRTELTGARAWALGFALPSLAGGGVGGWLLLRTPADRFAAIVPWLVLGATVLFMLQRPVMRHLARARTERSPDKKSDVQRTSQRPPVWILIFQFVVAVYGGYFGAGVGILMLAALGFMGLRNIHRMNGLKNWGGMCMNAVAAAMFAFSNLVNWPVAAAMALGSVSGGYVGSRTAQRVPQSFVRATVVVIGLASGIVLFISR